MMYLHKNNEQFLNAIELAYEQTGIMAQAIEKDYYVTMLLRLLSEKMILSIMVDKFNSYKADGYSTIAKAA